MVAVELVIWILLGGAAGIFLACVPGLHIASVLALLLFVFGQDLGFDGVVPLTIAMVCTFSVIGFIPMVVLSVPDESLFFAVTPAQAMNRDGRAIEAVLKGGIGVMAGVCLTSATVLLSKNGGLAPVFDAFRPHWHWMIWAAVLFMLMSEWPQRAAPGLSPWARFISVWRTLLAGMIVFALSGALGMIVFHGGPADINSSFAGLMPLLTGMFSVPWLLLTLRSRTGEISRDKSDGNEAVLMKDVLSGGITGWLGGAVAAVIPGVTAGVGGLLAGHAAAMNRRDAFVIAQGSSRGTYMAGGLLLMFVPGLSATRGGCAMMLRSIHDPFPALELMPAVAAALISTGLSLLISRYVYMVFRAVTSRIGLEWISLLSLTAVVVLNLIVTGLWGAYVLVLAAMIGTWAIASGARRLNCLGCILVPVGYALSGPGG